MDFTEALSVAQDKFRNSESMQLHPLRDTHVNDVPTLAAGMLVVAMRPLELELTRLREKLPKTADGVHIVPGMILYVVYHGDVYERSSWRIYNDGSFAASIKIGDGGEIKGFATVDCFSTRLAALEWLANMQPKETAHA